MRPTRSSIVSTIYNGADNDGSGIVALIEIAEAYALAAAAGQRPRRTVLFAAWDAEERDLLGAWAYTEAPLAPLARTVAVLNMDMIGRNEEVREGGGRRFRGLDLQTAEENNTSINIMGYTFSPKLAKVIEQANAGYDLRLKMDTTTIRPTCYAVVTSGRSSTTACRPSSSTPVCTRTTTRDSTVRNASTTTRWRRLRGWYTR